MILRYFSFFFFSLNLLETMTKSMSENGLVKAKMEPISPPLGSLFPTLCTAQEGSFALGSIKVFNSHQNRRVEKESRAFTRFPLKFINFQTNLVVMLIL